MPPWWRRRTTRADVLPANEQFKYSNIGYGLVGLVIEAVTGRPYAEHLREAVLAPLGLERTGPELDPARLGEYATGYSGNVLGERVPIDTVDTAALASATGFWSTAGDLVRYAAAHVLGEGTLLTDASKRRLHRAQWAVPGGDEHYGLGFGRQQVGERSLVGHGGGFPGHITRTVVDPSDGLTVVVLTNAIDGPAQELATGVVKIVDAALAAHRERTRTRRAAHDLSVFEGRWASLWGVTDLVDLGGRLRAIAPDQADPTAGIATLEVVDATTARFTDAGGYASPGETVVAHREDDGSTWVRIAGSRRRRLEDQQAWLAGAHPRHRPLTHRDPRAGRYWRQTSTRARSSLSSVWVPSTRRSAPPLKPPRRTRSCAAPISRSMPRSRSRPGVSTRPSV